MASKSIAVFGGGIAGLTVAHELSRRGHRVSLFESTAEVGGFFRSGRRADQGNLPTEYSWHGVGPWYHNFFDLVRSIPFDAAGSIYDRALSRPIDFGIFPDDTEARFYSGFRSIPKMFRLSYWDFLKASWLMLKTWSARRRTEERYSQIKAADAWKALLSERGYRTWRACFGPWIGSDWTRVSLHQAGQFFRKQLIPFPRHLHPSDVHGPAWSHGAGDGWLLFRGPSSEYWFDRWVVDLKSQGVAIRADAPLHRLGYEGGMIAEAELQTGEKVVADYYVLATTPFAAAEILARTPALEERDELCLFKPLIREGPHIQVSFRIGFAERINFPRQRTAVVVADSEFNLTLFAVEQAWDADVGLGDNIRSLWTGTSCVATVPGTLYQRPVARCTREQFLSEVKAQLTRCNALNQQIREANGGRDLKDFELAVMEVWPEWHFSSDGIGGTQPKWVNTTRTQSCLPKQITPVSNLLLAGAHTRTEADVWSIEGAVESGRRAAKAIDPRVLVIAQHQPGWLRGLSSLDDWCFKHRLPHILDFMLVATSLAVASTLLAFW